MIFIITLSEHSGLEDKCISCDLGSIKRLRFHNQSQASPIYQRNISVNTFIMCYHLLVSIIILFGFSLAYLSFSFLLSFFHPLDSSHSLELLPQIPKALGASTTDLPLGLLEGAQLHCFRLQANSSRLRTATTPTVYQHFGHAVIESRYAELAPYHHPKARCLAGRLALPLEPPPITYPRLFTLLICIIYVHGGLKLRGGINYDSPLLASSKGK